MNQLNCEFPDLPKQKVFIEIDDSLQEIIVSESERHFLVEGDVIIAQKKDLDFNNPKGLIIPISSGKRWPDGNVHYTWDESLENDNRIIDAIEHWESNTQIRFFLWDENSGIENYINFTEGIGCSSFIGMIGGSQDITLSQFCSTGNVIHEIGHAVGLEHEHKRPDRDEFIRINFNNIEAGQEHNFEMSKKSQVVGEYDFGSIMHYGLFAFSNNNLPTIEVLDDNPPQIGQRNGLSEGDIDTVDINYTKRVIPCAYEMCDEPPRITVGTVMQRTIYTPYEPDLNTSSGLIIDKPFTKVFNLTVDENNPKIEFDLSSAGEGNSNFYAVIIENLIFNSVSPSGFVCIISWKMRNIPSLIASLEGAKGLDAPPVNGKGTNGLPGGTGKRGQTKHGATIFFFVKNLMVTQGNADDLTFRFDLEGITGGHGGMGGRGSGGTKGAKGRNARNGDFGTCKRGGRHGKKGGNPGPGGRGGNGGCGGNGGSVKFYFNDEKFWQIFGQSEFNLSGHQMTLGEERRGNGGEPGIAGKEGEKGDKGSHAGNCLKHGNRGAQDGSPVEGTFEWQNWNLGWGLPSPSGKEGDQLLEKLDTYTSAVFYNPN